MTDIELVDNRITLRLPFKFLTYCKALPGAKWNPQAKQWSVPAEPWIAQQVVRTIPVGVTYSPEVKELAGAAESVLRPSLAGPLAQPPVRTGDEWAHQLAAYHLAHPLQGAMLAMEMGTGKTKVAIDLVQNRGHKLVLVICPKTVVDVWPRELEKHAAVPYRVLSLGTGAVVKRTQAFELELRRREALRDESLLVVVTNYDAIRSDILLKRLLKVQWDCVIADESHRIKKAMGATSKAVHQIGQRAAYRLALTGTPIPHSPLDIFGQYRFLNSNIYGYSFTRFRSQYAVMGGYGGYEILGFQNMEDYERKYHSISYRVRARDVLDLKEPLHIERFHTLEPAAAGMYADMRKDFIAWIGDGVEVTAANALVKLLRLQQITGGVIDSTTVDTTKAELFAEVLDELVPDEPVIVFCRFVSDLDQIGQVAINAGRPYHELSGRVNDLAIWQKEGGVLGVQIQAGGLGIDLTKAHYCVYWSTGFSLGDYLQSEARIHRPGQSEVVYYIHLLASGTVDERIWSALRNRRDVVASIIDGGIE